MYNPPSMRDSGGAYIDDDDLCEDEDIIYLEGYNHAEKGKIEDNPYNKWYIGFTSSVDDKEYNDMKKHWWRQGFIDYNIKDELKAK